MASAAWGHALIAADVVLDGGGNAWVVDLNTMSSFYHLDPKVGLAILILAQQRLWTEQQHAPPSPLALAPCLRLVSAGVWSRTSQEVKRSGGSLKRCAGVFLEQGGEQVPAGARRGGKSVAGVVHARAVGAHKIGHGHHRGDGLAQDPRPPRRPVRFRPLARPCCPSHCLPRAVSTSTSASTCTNPTTAGRGPRRERCCWDASRREARVAAAEEGGAHGRGLGVAAAL